MPHLVTTDELRNAWNAEGEQARRDFVSDLLCTYNHEWKHLLTEQINDRYLEQNAEKQRLVADTSVNLLRWVTDEIAAIYSEPCTRLINGSADGLDLYEAGGLIDFFMDEACKLTHLCREVALRPLWDEDKQQLCFDIVTPDKFTVVPHPVNPVRYLAVIVKLPTSAYNGDTFAVWTDGSHFICDSTFTPYESESNPEHLNPYGVIPYVITHARFPASGAFFNEQASKGLYDATLQAGVQKTDHNHLRHIQSFKQLAITGAADESLSRMALDPSLCAIIKNPQASVQVMDLQANLREHLETLYLGTRPTLTMAGIWQDVVKGSSDSSSGYALSLKMHKQTTIWQQLRGLWTLYERWLYAVAGRVLEVDAGRTLPTGELLIDYPEIGPAANPLDKATVAEKYQILGMSRQNIWREVFDKTEEWIEQNEQELANTTLADAPMVVPPMPEPEPALEEEAEAEAEEELLI